jgi:ubiquinone/menaquinone biosynthesis C-methylase UbiE
MLVRVPRWISQYRVDQLVRLFGERLRRFEVPQVLDVGCGHARITARLKEMFPAASFRGVDVVVRPGSSIEVIGYDGTTLPFPDKSMDVVLLIDVLHHADHPAELLKECGRVSRSLVLVKDHLCESSYDWLRLAWMDWFGNRPFNIPMTYEYLSRRQWQSAFDHAGLVCDRLDDRIRTCPPPTDLILDRGVQMFAELSPQRP